jgi:hypothetical protein
MRSYIVILVLSAFPRHVSAAELAFRAQEIGAGLGVGYAVVAVDMNDDRRPDVVVVDTARVIWYENPTWRMHTIIEGQTKKDNVCIAPYDVDGDGRLDFALGADWHPTETHTGGTIQWLARPKSGEAERWNVYPIAEEPTMHRMRWADIDGDGRAELIAIPLHGRDTKAPDWDSHGVRMLAFRVPADPRRDPWPVEVLNEDLHVTHNFWPTDLDHDGKLDIVVASFEGVSLLKRKSDGGWTRTLIGEGNQKTSPSRGASEIKHGRLASGADYLATIEPWHGFQVVVYTLPISAADSAGGGQPLWPRQVLDEELKWGHAVWCADLDGDGDEELVIGVRDTKDKANPCGLRIYDPTNAQGTLWTRHVFDPAGVAIEDLAVADLDTDGKPDIVAVGRQTKNVRIYWNETTGKR